MFLLPSDPSAQKKLIIGVIPVVALFGYWYFLHGGFKEEVTTLETRLEKLESQNVQAKAQAARGGPELERKLALYEEHITRLEQLIPLSEEVPELLHAMTLRAQEAGVELSLMRPNDEEPGPYYTRQTYDMAVIGQYHDIGQFLAAVGSLPRIVTPIEVSVQPHSKSRGGRKPRGSADDLLNAEFRIKTYVLPAAAPAEPKPNARA